MNNRKTNRKIITIMLTMIISVSSCFSAYCAETPAAEAASTVPVQAGIAAETEAAEASAIGASEAEAAEVPDSAVIGVSEEEPSAAAIEEAEEEPSDVAIENAEEEPSDAAVGEAEEETAAEAYEHIEEVLSDAAGEEAEEEMTGAADGKSEEDPGAAGGDGPQAAGEAAEEIILEEETEEQVYTPQDTKTSDELFAGYVDAEFGITDDVSGKKLLQKRRATAGSRLTGDTLAAYNYISSQLPLIAAGEITSTHFTVPDEEVSFISETAWTAEELGVPAIAENNAIRQDAKEAASAKLRQEYFDLSILIDALLADHPYLLYWYDKTPKTTADGYVYRAFTKNGVWYLGYRGSLKLNFPVAGEYADGDYTVDASVGQTVQASVENALAVVSENEDLPDHEKLAAYRQTICDLTSYNYAAIADHAPYGNPWQLIWVFDGDPATKVVCEGYAKAFKYLCDRSSFEGDIDCKAVTGKINGSGHMWNLVTMEDGWNYLTDVTNCDKGTVGADDKLFLTGALGSPHDGYTVNLGGASSVYYSYDQDMIDLWPPEELTVPMYSYPPTIENAVVEGIADKEFTGEEITQELTVSYSGRELSEGTDYTVAYENNTDVGTARVIIEGAGSYRGTIEKEFEIEKAMQPLAVSAGKIVNGRNEEVRITGAQGGTAVEIADPAIAEIMDNDGAGTITVRGVSTGTTTLTVTAAETENYKETVLETEIIVVPGASAHVGLTNVASGIKVYWEGVAGAKYYKVYRGDEYLFTTSRTYATDLAVKSDNGRKYTYRVVASTTKENDSGDSTIARTGSGYRLIPVGITSLRNNAAGKIAVTYGKNAKSTGYVIRFGLKKDMSDAKVITVQGAGTLKRVLSGVKKGKTYYVQVRTYRLENGVRYYSGYCTTKSVKVTK